MYVNEFVSTTSIPWVSVVSIFMASVVPSSILALPIPDISIFSSISANAACNAAVSAAAK